MRGWMDPARGLPPGPACGVPHSVPRLVGLPDGGTPLFATPATSGLRATLPASCLRQRPFLACGSVRFTHGLSPARVARRPAPTPSPFSAVLAARFRFPSPLLWPSLPLLVPLWPTGPPPGPPPLPRARVLSYDGDAGFRADWLW